ncbi:ubiquitin-specific protease ubp15 [Ancistrocladus abbreviatus]
MLEPREADIPALFLVLVVLPLVTYILLGKWSEASKKKERISLLAHLAAEESLRAETMAAAAVVPFAPPPKIGFHECSLCHSPATTRCSRCKSVRYCSGKCQIIHWRQGHKEECRPPESFSSSLKAASVEEPGKIWASSREDMYPDSLPVLESSSSDVRYPSSDPGASAATTCLMDAPQSPMLQGKPSGRKVSCKTTTEMLVNEDNSAANSTSICWSRAASSNSSSFNPSKDIHMRHKVRGGGSVNSGNGFSVVQGIGNPTSISHGNTASNTLQNIPGLEHQSQDLLEPSSNCAFSGWASPTKVDMNVNEVDRDFIVDDVNFLKEGTIPNSGVSELNCSSEMLLNNVSTKSENGMQSEGVKVSKSPKLRAKTSREHTFYRMEKNGHASHEPIARMGNVNPAQGGNGITTKGFMKMMGLKKLPKVARKEASEVSRDSHKRVRMLFPYQEFTKFFQCEVFDLAPRGLLNCGNSCYANAVLQCLSCTRPLVVYLLKRTHSRSCCIKNWCLMCELEQYVTMLRETGGPLSPSRILLHMRSINSQIGDGSQEDAHEFLRLLVASMQSICLEEMGGEKQVHPSLQETTFIQHTFGGRLRSKVECLRCHHESERYENIMDLTLEIFGWVESLQDALTQFTTAEDLDGENMYRCGRCASYVRARKQLSIDVAPNILTIVLKRFQEGSYGKINKCITFPDMLDMVPFMTGTHDIPPLYMLYAVVVHMDTLNASFSGHYVSYVKDLQGNWFRIDDSEVQPVPMFQVMSEGAYILFYVRSSPRNLRTCMKTATQQQAPASAQYRVSNAHRSSARLGVGLEPLCNLGAEASIAYANHTSNGILRSANNGFTPMMETYAEPVSMEFSDATSSDWSLFTSSDESSFTTESTRDSFSTADYSDSCNVDPVTSFFNTLYSQEPSSQRTISCRMFSGSGPVTRYVSEEKGYVFDSYYSYPSTNPLNEVHGLGNLQQVSVPPGGTFPLDSEYHDFVNDGIDEFLRT